MFDEIFSWILLIGMLLLAVVTTKVCLEAKATNNEAYVFGYRPIFVQTGSMEPYLMTNSFALTKEVTDISQLEVGDVVSFHLDTEDGNRLCITHRIIEIKDDFIYTKGDNNRVADNYPLTIDNIESEVLTVFNQSAWLIAKWHSSLNGKVFIISTALAIVLFIFAIKIAIGAYIEEKSDKKDYDSVDIEPDVNKD